MFRPGVMIVAISLLSIATPVVAAPDPATFPARVDAYFEKEINPDQVPGVAVAVLRGDEVLVAKGYGLANIEHNVPVTRDTIFQLGSVGKMFTAVAVMTQVEQRKIRLDDPIVKYLPDAPAAWKNITVHHLLAHTSGIPNFGADFNYRSDYTDDELVAIAAAMPLSFEPGKRWAYSNTGYELLGFLIKKATGRSYLDILKSDVFQPLDMKTARGISDADIVPNRSSGYEVVDGQLKNQNWVSPTMNSTADGALYAAINDMIAWARGVEQGKILSGPSWKEIYTPVRLNSGKTYPYGYGWFIETAAGKPHLHHGGAWQGFRAHYSRYLSGNLSVVILTNSGGANPRKIADDVAGLWNPALIAPPKSPKPEPAIAQQVTALLESTRAGTLRREDFAVADAGIADLMIKYNTPILKDVGALTKLELVQREERGDTITYSYAATFGDRTLQVEYEIVPGAGVSSLLISP